MYYRYKDTKRNGTYLKADNTTGSYSDAYNFVNGPWINGTMLDEVINAGYPYYYLFNDTLDDADGSMNKDGETFFLLSSYWGRCIFVSTVFLQNFHSHSMFFPHSIIASNSNF